MAAKQTGVLEVLQLTSGLLCYPLVCSSASECALEHTYFLLNLLSGSKLVTRKDQTPSSHKSDTSTIGTNYHKQKVLPVQVKPISRTDRNLSWPT
jgi:hypothetical protein